MLGKRKKYLIAALLLNLVLLASVRGLSAEQSGLFINEILAGNASTNLDTDFYEYSSWIEIYNGGSSAVDLRNYALSYVDYKADEAIVWKIRSSVSVPAGGQVLFWADEEDGRGTHANFELDMRGSEITLLDPTNEVVDSVTYDMRDGMDLLPDIAYGRESDGGAEWVYFDQPTPAAANTTPGFTEPMLTDPPDFAPPGGFYTGEQTVSLATTEEAGTIRYTTDGSIPISSSALYTGSLSISRPTVVRARVFAPGKLASQTASHTYLIDASRNLAVISLATKPAHLFDDTIGIYVKGTNGRTGRCSDEPVNWNQPWERPASMEMFEPDGSRVVAQDVGFEIFGGCTRLYNRKSLEIKARRSYGDKDIDYQVLPDKPIDSYKRLVLRNSGNDAYRTLFRDALQQYLVKDTMDIDYQAYRPVVVFLNGQYWGIYNLRDKADEAFVEQNYDLDADDEFDMIEGRLRVQAGNAAAWKSLYEFIATKDLRVPANYAYIKSQIDLDEYMNYVITEIYINNGDWPLSNVRYWRAYEDGRWRWVLYDLDFGFDSDEIGTDWLLYLLTCTDCTKDVPNQATIFRKLMQNSEFRTDFAQRFASHLNISFNGSRVNGMIDRFKAGIEPEMAAHIARWGKPASLGEWNALIAELREFANLRPLNTFSHLDAYLGSPGTARLTVNVKGNGDVLVAGVKTPGSGYSGRYFRSIPVTLKAASEPGWLFMRWVETGTKEARLSMFLTGDQTRTAVFEQASRTVFVPAVSASGR
jgi:hypothetical protein